MSTIAAVRSPAIGIQCRKCLNAGHNCQAVSYDHTQPEEVREDYPLCRPCAMGQTCPHGMVCTPGVVMGPELYDPELRNREYAAPEPRWSTSLPAKLEPKPKRTRRGPGSSPRIQPKVIAAIKGALRLKRGTAAIAEEYGVSRQLVNHYRKKIAQEDNPEGEKDMIPVAVQPQHDALIDAMFQKLPPDGADFPRADREKWLDAMAAIFFVVYRTPAEEKQAAA